MANNERPKCASYEVGKGHHHPNKVNETKRNTTNDQELNKDNLLSRKMVSADHYISRG